MSKLNRRQMLKLAAASAGSTAFASLGVSAEPAKVTAQAETVKLLFHTRTDQDADYAKVRLETFRDAFPNIEIEIDETPHADFTTKLTTLAAGGSLGDCWQTFVVSVMYPFGASGIAMDLNPLVDADPEVNLDDYFPAGIEQCKWQDKLIGLPTGGHAGWSSMWTNVDAFKDAGAALPEWDWTYDGKWLEAVQAATTEDRFGYQFEYTAQQAYLFVRSWGGDWIDPENPTQPLVKSDESRAAFQFMRDLVYKHGISPRQDQVVDQMFANELSNSWSTGIWVAHTLETIVEDKFEWSGLPMPAGPAGRGTFIGVDPLQINSRSDKKEAAFEWVKWMTNREAGLTGASNSTTLIKSVWDEMESLQQPHFQNMARWFEEAKGWTLPSNARINEFVAAFNQNFQALMLPDADVEEALNNMEFALKDVLMRPSL